MKGKGRKEIDKNNGNNNSKRIENCFWRENNFVFLELKDNGVGFGPGIDFENSHSLGLQLVNTLIEQIEGKLKFKSQKDIGTEVLVTFKM